MTCEVCGNLSEDCECEQEEIYEEENHCNDNPLDETGYDGDCV